MWNCKEQQCTVLLAQALLRCVSVGLEACAVMQCCPIVSQKMTLCPIWLCLPNFFLPGLWCFFSQSLPHVFLFSRHSQGDFPSFPSTAAFPSFVLGGFSADKRWEQGRLTESREGEAREEAVWKWEETDEIIKQETGMDAFLSEDANTGTRHNRKLLRWHQETEVLARPHGFFKQNRWLTQLSHQSENQCAFTTVSTNSARIWDEVSKFRDQRNWECKKEDVEMEAGNRETDLKMTIRRREEGGLPKQHFQHDQSKEVLATSEKKRSNYYLRQGRETDNWCLSVLLLPKQLKKARRDCNCIDRKS